MKRALAAVLCLAASTTAHAATSCSPNDNTARVLSAPKPNAVHPDWAGESYVGLSWSLATDGKPIKTDTGSYLKGDLVSPRGGVVNRGVYVVAREWNCTR